MFVFDGLQEKKSSRSTALPDLALRFTQCTVSLFPPGKVTDPKLGEMSCESAANLLGEWKAGILPIYKYSRQCNQNGYI